jgi:diguanylate cyclase (GGDEF)-like protein
MSEPVFGVDRRLVPPSVDPAPTNAAANDGSSLAFLSELPNILYGLPVGLHIEDTDFQSLFVNDSFVKIFGYTLAEIASPDDWWALAYPDPQYRDLVRRQWFEAAALANANKCEISPQEWVVRCKGGEQKVIQFHLRRVGNVNVHVYIDVTARHRLEAELRRLANTDPLTGIANRRRFFETAAAIMATGQRLAVLVFDLDHFKAVNDGYGHAAGDQVLVEIANRCRGALDETQLLARLGGEEFGVLLPGCDHAAGALVAERLRAAVARAPVIVSTAQLAVTITITISIGGACGVSDGVAFDTLLVRADRALYAAKRAGRNQARFEAA